MLLQFFIKESGEQKNETGVMEKTCLFDNCPHRLELVKNIGIIIGL